ncbi:DUF1564 family protein [Leptospira semungkisensis]|uniref:DUF1564 family protein n=1 Tax=Leptospira semungkisensis TaxID=2484985 RepID=A0A4R9G708_9LEPT|nr:DUF1564 family protein [Leptospira semungkisensis]TGK07396.1 DUF1564 family protein [Leptospira semungkisensis]
MRLKLITNSKRIKAKTLKAHSSVNELSVCTVILPKDLHKKVRKEWRGKRAGARCLKELLFLYAKELQEKDRMNRDPDLLLYQRKEEDTKTNWNRLNFRPDTEDWSKLGLLARKHGVSRCYLFTFLLERYFKGEKGPGSLQKKKAA